MTRRFVAHSTSIHTLYINGESILSGCVYYATYVYRTCSLCVIDVPLSTLYWDKLGMPASPADSHLNSPLSHLVRLKYFLSFCVFPPGFLYFIFLLHYSFRTTTSSRVCIRRRNQVGIILPTWYIALLLWWYSDSDEEAVKLIKMEPPQKKSSGPVIRDEGSILHYN